MTFIPFTFQRYALCIETDIKHYLSYLFARKYQPMSMFLEPNIRVVDIAGCPFDYISI